MNNIENSIRHLQSSIAKRGTSLKLLHIEFKRLANVEISEYDLYYSAEKAHIECLMMSVKKRITLLSKRQKTEKKMLAMMYKLDYLRNFFYVEQFIFELDGL